MTLHIVQFCAHRGEQNMQKCTAKQTTTTNKISFWYQVLMLHSTHTSTTLDILNITIYNDERVPKETILRYDYNNVRPTYKQCGQMGAMVE